MFNESVSKRIVSVQFGLFSPEEIKSGSVCNVIHSETMESNMPKESGLIDLRMGTTERQYLCKTCNNNSFNCSGHFGHIELCKPMFHIGYLTQTKKLLECVCFYCSKIKSRKTTDGKFGLEKCWNLLKTKTICEIEEYKSTPCGCGNKQPMIKKDGLNLIAYMKGSDEEGKVILNGERVYNIFKKIAQEDYELLGFTKEFCKPENLLFTVVPVSPPCVRPSIVLGSGLRGEDDLTHKYSDIIKTNGLLKKYEQEGAPGHIVRDYESLLQYHLATLINNDIGGIPQATQKSGRPIKSIAARLKGKEGRVRGNLMGKRVDFSARSVITPDSNISLDEVGVPVEIAKIHTFPEKVNSFNFNELQKIVNNGPSEYPGANYVIRDDGTRIDLKYNRFEVKLEKGFIVERHMKNGDNILFNRQPSLHKMSMMGHKARIMDNKTFRLNLSVTSPYNADFDGDEMNLHMPQSYNARAELDLLANVENQIISPQSNKPVVGIVQDTLVGLRLFTLRDTFFNKRETMNLLYSFKEKCDFNAFLKSPAISSPVQLWTGKQIFSAILPKIYYFRNCNSANGDLSTNDSFVIIKDGKLLSGVMDKRSCGAQQGGLIHIVVNDFGNNEAKRFINAIQNLINYFILHISSFSIGIGDSFVNNSDSKINISKAILEVDSVIESAKKNELEKMPGQTMMETFESKVNMILNKARDFKGEISIYNNMNLMVMSGSKGSTINISQMTSCVGQQNVEGKRIPFGFDQRSLPHFHKFDFSAKSKGFVRNSYFTGMKPNEFFFHAMGGREGLIDTAIKTAETGYIQRRLVKALEDATARHDYSVRNSSGMIYQFVYGEDSFDATHLENVQINKNNFKERFFIDNFVDLKYAIDRNSVSEEVFLILQSDLELQMKLDDEYEYLNKNKNILDGGYASPVNIERNLSKYNIHKFQSKTDSLSPYFILDSLDSLMTSNHFLNYYIRYSLNVKFCLTKLNSDSFKAVIDEINKKIMKARVNANEMVGTLAAQSVGEPATQMTLNTFHLAGVASTVTMGVPRLNEIINVSKNIKTPSMKIELIESDIISARTLQNQIEYVCIEDIYTSLKIIYDPNVFSTNIEEDLEFVTNYFEMPDEGVDYTKLGKFLIRLEFNRYSLISKNITLEYISDRLRGFFKHKSHIITSDENDQKLVLRIRLEVGEIECLEFYTEYEEKLLKLNIKGLENIKKAYLTKVKSDDNSEKWALQTDGINFLSILSTQNVHSSNVIPNDFYVIFETLGIEAARESIINELNLVMESNGSYVNNRHLSLLADVMTVCGYLTGITRHGVNREMKAGALKKASFEETVDILFDAAMASECNSTMGISENIMLGQLAPIGTGSVELLLDIKKLDISTTIKNSNFGIRSPDSDSGSFSPIGYSSPSSARKLFSPEVHSSSYSNSTFYNPLSTSYNPMSTSFAPSYSPRSPHQIPFQAYTPSYVQGGNMSQAFSNSSQSYSSNPYSPSKHAYSPSGSPHSPSHLSVGYMGGLYSPNAAPMSGAYSQRSTYYSPNGATTQTYNPSPTAKYSPATASPFYNPGASANNSSKSPFYDYENAEDYEEKKYD